MFNTEIKKIIEKYNLFEEAVESCYYNFDSYREEYPDDIKEVTKNYNPDKFDVSINSIALKCWESPEYEHVNIIIEMYMFYKDVHIGVYDIEFGLDGVVEDDIIDFF